MSEGDSNPPEYIPKLVQMYKEGKFPLDKISKVYSYKDMDAAIHAMHDGTVGFPLLLAFEHSVLTTSSPAQVIKPIIQFK